MSRSLGSHPQFSCILDAMEEFNVLNGGAVRFLNPSAIDEAGSELDRDQLRALLVMESSYFTVPIPCETAVAGSKPVISSWRRKMSDWCFRVVDHFELDRDIVALAMSMFDRFLNLYGEQSMTPHKTPTEEAPTTHCPCLSCRKIFDQKSFRLACATCLYIATKGHPRKIEGHSKSPEVAPLKLFVQLGLGHFDKENMLRMEHVILSTLQWKVNPPVPSTFISYLVQLFPAERYQPLEVRTHYALVLHVLQELARFITELAVCIGDELAYLCPSKIAFAALLVSMDLVTFRKLPVCCRDTLSHRAGAYGLSIMNAGTQNARFRLQELLQPDCLRAVDDLVAGDTMALAVRVGILDLSGLSNATRYRTVTPPETPSRVKTNGSQDPHSPRSVQTCEMEEC